MAAGAVEPVPPEHRHPRREDRSKDEGWIQAFLTQGEAGVFSAVLEGRPFALPRVFAYDASRQAVYVHGAFGGETGKVLAQGGAPEGVPGGPPGEAPGGVPGRFPGGVPMILTVFEMGRLLPAEEAGEFGVEYASVVVTGRAVEVTDPEEVEHGLTLLMEKYAPHLRPGEDYRPVTPEEVARTAVIRLDIESWSGKAKTAAADFPGAYRFQDVR